MAYVRVRDLETSHHLTVSRAQFDLNPDVYELLKRPATYADGTPLPPKHHSSLLADSPTPQTRGGQTSPESKEK